MNVRDAKLGDVAQFIRGVTFKPDDLVPLGSEGSVACLRTKNVQIDLDLSDVWAIPDTFVKDKERLCREGDIILSTANSWNLVGKASWVPELDWPTAAGGFVSLLRADEKAVAPRYLFHWITWARTQAALRSCARQTTNISNLSVPQASDLRIPLPPLEEQKRIAAILDQADALRRLRRRALDRLNTLGQAIFHEMFVGQSEAECGWQTAALADLAPAHDRINYGIVQPGDHDPEGVPIIRVGDLLTPRVDFAGIKRVSKAIDESYQRSRLKGGEILVGCVGSVGTTVIAPTSFAGANIARAVARIPLNSDVCDPQFVCHQLRSHRVQNYLKKEIRLVAQPTLNIKQIREIEILLPPLELQRRFSSRIDVLQKATTLESSALKNSECLCTSLQHRAFQGEL